MSYPGIERGLGARSSEVFSRAPEQQKTCQLVTGGLPQARGFLRPDGGAAAKLPPSLLFLLTETARLSTMRQMPEKRLAEDVKDDEVRKRCCEKIVSKHH